MPIVVFLSPLGLRLEKDALTTALGNDEHGGRVRGKAKVPWKVGFDKVGCPGAGRPGGLRNP